MAPPRGTLAPAGPEWLLAHMELEQCGSSELLWFILQNSIHFALDPLAAGLWWKGVSHNKLADLVRESNVVTEGLTGEPQSRHYVTLGHFGSEVERWEDFEDRPQGRAGFMELDFRHPGQCPLNP